MAKSFDLKSLIRSNILHLNPYRSARNDFDNGILLDANENSLGAPFQNDLELHRYPMPYQEELRMKIADFRSVDKEHIFVGVGSDKKPLTCCIVFSASQEKIGYSLLLQRMECIRFLLPSMMLA